MKVAHGDYAWGKEGYGFSEAWVRNNVTRREVYIVELDGTSVGTFLLDLDDERHCGDLKNRSPATYMGFACEKASMEAGSAASCLSGVLPG
ncbi:hypothetical protein GCM10027093_73880 [Paraburkholderia jirisanensis]